MWPSATPYHNAYAGPGAGAVAPGMIYNYNVSAVPPPTPLPLGILVRQVWATNFAAEMAAVHAFVGGTRALHVSVNVQYPGVVHGAGHHQLQDPFAFTAAERYAFLKANVDDLKPLQLGLAVVREDGLCMAWEFNLRDFDRATDPQAPHSVAYLAGHGMDFDAHRRRGVPVHSLSMALQSCGLLRRQGVSWVTHDGAYHVAYFLKILTGMPLPGDIAGFLDLAGWFLCGNVFDVARVVGDRPGLLPIGLESIAAALGLVPPLSVSPHLGGARAALTLQAFVTLGPACYRGLFI